MNPPGLVLLITINAGTLLAILVYGYKIITFINRIEFKTELMWADYTKRTGHSHRRSGDLDELDEASDDGA